MSKTANRLDHTKKCNSDKFVLRGLLFVGSNGPHKASCQILHFNVIDLIATVSLLKYAYKTKKYNLDQSCAECPFDPAANCPTKR